MFQTNFQVNEQNNTIVVQRSFAANRSKVWQAWTTLEILEKWWAPKPWTTETKVFDFSEGGQWLYAMVSPEGQKHWSLVKYQDIEPESHYVAKDAFSDETGKISENMPQSSWDCVFSDNGETAAVVVTITFSSAEALRKTVEMGFKEGLTMTLSSLDDVLKQ